MVDRHTNWTDQTDFPDGFVDYGVLRSSRRTARTVSLTFAKVRVASSNLVIRSKKYQLSGPTRAADLHFRLAVPMRRPLRAHGLRAENRCSRC